MKLEDYQRKYKNKESNWPLKRYQAYEKFCEDNQKPLRFKKEYQGWYNRLKEYMEERGFKE
jgi:hypothetical protein